MTDLVDILVVEDNPQDAEQIRHALREDKSLGQIAVARDGVEALAFLFGKGAWANFRLRALPKVIFLDLKLPRLSGLEVLKRLRLDARTRGIPVMVLISSRDERALLASYRLGASSHLFKSADADRFAETVRAAGRRR